MRQEGSESARERRIALCKSDHQQQQRRRRRQQQQQQQHMSAGYTKTVILLRCKKGSPSGELIATEMARL